MSYIENDIEDLQGAVDYVRVDLADLQQDLREQALGLDAVVEQLEGLEARVAELAEALLLYFATTGFEPAASSAAAYRRVSDIFGIEAGVIGPGNEPLRVLE